MAGCQCLHNTILVTLSKQYRNTDFKGIHISLLMQSCHKGNAIESYKQTCRLSGQLNWQSTVSQVRPLASACEIAKFAKLDTVFFFQSLIHIWGSSTSADHIFPSKQMDTDSTSPQVVCTLQVIMPVQFVCTQPRMHSRKL